MRKLLASLFLIITLGTAQVTYAGPYEDGVAARIRGDYATALRLWGPLAAQGDATAQTSLGFMYERGQGVPQNDKEAVRLFGLAAAQGGAYAQGALGVMYESGRGVVQNYVRAHMWFNLSASNG